MDSDCKAPTVLRLKDIDMTRKKMAAVKFRKINKKPKKDDEDLMNQLITQQNTLIESFWNQFYHIICKKPKDFYSEMDGDQYDVNKLFNEKILLTENELNHYKKYDYIERQASSQKDCPHDVFNDYAKSMRVINKRLGRWNNKPLLWVIGCTGSGKSFTSHRVLDKYCFSAFGNSDARNMNNYNITKNRSTVLNSCARLSSNSLTTVPEDASIDDVKDENEEKDAVSILRFAVSYKFICDLDWEDITSAFCWRILSLFALAELVETAEGSESNIENIMKIILESIYAVDDWRDLDLTETLLMIIYGHKGIGNNLPIVMAIDKVLLLETAERPSRLKSKQHRYNGKKIWPELLQNIGRFVDNYDSNSGKRDCIVTITAEDDTHVQYRCFQLRIIPTSLFDFEQMQKQVQTSYGHNLMSIFRKDLEYYENYLIGLTNGFAAYFGSLISYLNDTTKMNALFRDIRKDKKHNLDQFITGAIEQMTEKLDVQYQRMKYFFKQKNIQLFPFELGDALLIYAQRYKRTITLCNGDKIASRDIVLNAMMQISDENEIIFPSCLLMRYADELQHELRSEDVESEQNNIINNDAKACDTLLESVQDALKIPTVYEIESGNEWKKRLQDMHVIRSWQYLQNKTDNINCKAKYHGLVKTLKEYFGKIEQSSVEQLWGKTFIFPRIVKIVHLKDKQQLKSEELVPRVIYVPKSPVFPGIDYCFKIYNTDINQWHLLCIQANATIDFGLTKWITADSEADTDTVALKAIDVSKDADNCIFVALNVTDVCQDCENEKPTAEGQAKIEAFCDKHGLNGEVYKKIVCVPLDCLDGFFGTQYEHLLRWISTCAKYETHAHEGANPASKMKNNSGNFNKRKYRIDQNEGEKEEEQDIDIEVNNSEIRNQSKVNANKTRNKDEHEVDAVAKNQHNVNKSVSMRSPIKRGFGTAFDEQTDHDQPLSKKHKI